MAGRMDLFFLVFFSTWLKQVDVANLVASSLYEKGNINLCLEVLGKELERFEVLPGIGWDNLENRDGGQIVAYNYSKCRTTDDGKFIIPDNVFTVPLKTSHLEIFGEMFKHWTEFKSTTASSININAELNKASYGISGTFSSEFENVKKHQISDRSITTRVQAKYVRYSAKLQPGSQLSPSFRQRLRNIAFYIQKKLTEDATYESQILVRDFGTHVISHVDAGAIVAQIDEIKSSFAKNFDKDSSKIIAAASASFQSFFNVSGQVKYTKSASEELIKQYKGNRTYSVINAIGGPIFQPHDFTLNDWASEVKSNLVAVDRLGFPIYELITIGNLPEIPPRLLYYVVKYVKSAIEEYYKFNIYRGCTNVTKPNFSYIANVDDGTCSSEGQGFPFGGVYQTCQETEKLSRDVCEKFSQKNPLTGDFSCPSGYEPLFLFENTITESELKPECTKWWCLKYVTFRGECCTNVRVYSYVTYKAYWCVRHGKNIKHDGFLFGGIFTATIDNPMTQSRECPLYFYPLKLGSDMRVCVSDDYELGHYYSVPFSGLFSCEAGNPLAIEDDNSTDTTNLHSYLNSASPKEWPRRCPSNYSMHLASVERHTCEINYCILAGSFSYKGLPAIRRPPFIEIPTTAFDDGYIANKTYVVGDDRKTWITVTPADAKDIESSSDSVVPFKVLVISLSIILATF